MAIADSAKNTSKNHWPGRCARRGSKVCEGIEVIRFFFSKGLIAKDEAILAKFCVRNVPQVK